MENMYLYVRYSFSVRQSEQIDAWKSCIQIKYRISMRLSALNTAFPCVCKMPNTCNGIASSVQRVKIHIWESTQPTEKKIIKLMCHTYMHEATEDIIKKIDNEGNAGSTSICRSCSRLQGVTE